MRRIEKAWIINTSNWNEPWFAPYMCFYADTRGKAKKEVLREIRFDDFKDKKDEDIGFLNLKINRSIENDKYLIDGILKTKSEIEYENKVKLRNEKLDKLLSENPDGKAYIRKGGYYYRPNSCGYTEYKAQAGIYTLKEAISEVKGCDLRDCMNAILIDIEEHNNMISNQILNLQSKIIN